MAISVANIGFTDTLHSADFPLCVMHVIVAEPCFNAVMVPFSILTTVSSLEYQLYVVFASLGVKTGEKV